MKLTTLVFLGSLGLAAVSAAPPRQDPPQELPEQDAFLQLVTDYAAAVRQWRADVRAAAKESKEKEAEARAKHPIHEYWPRVEALVAAGDGRGLVWMVEACEDRLDGRTAIVAKKSELVDLLLGEHADAEWAADQVVKMLPRQRAWFDEEWVRAKLEALAGAAKQPEVIAAAYYELALRLSGSKATAEERKRASELLAKIESEYAGTRPAALLADKRSSGSYEVGGTPADFEAQDVDNVAFKLSDYRGKIVLLDFWGFW